MQLRIYYSVAQFKWTTINKNFIPRTIYTNKRLGLIPRFDRKIYI